MGVLTIPFRVIDRVGFSFRALKTATLDLKGCDVTRFPVDYYHELW